MCLFENHHHFIAVRQLEEGGHLSFAANCAEAFLTSGSVSEINVLTVMLSAESTIETVKTDKGLKEVWGQRGGGAYIAPVPLYTTDLHTKHSVNCSFHS